MDGYLENFDYAYDADVAGVCPWLCTLCQRSFAARARLAVHLRKYHLTFPNVVDSGIKLATAYGTTALPETFVIDRHGRIVGISRGQVSGPVLNRWITQALAS